MKDHSSRTHPTLERSPKRNWVEKVNGLPDFIERVAKHIFYDNAGYTISRAIAAAVSQVKKWAAKGNAKAIRAVALWEAKKARSNKTKNLSDEVYAEVLVQVDLAKKNSEASGGKNKIGAKSAGVTSASKLRSQVAAFKRDRSKYSPEQQKKIIARLKSSAQRLGISISLSANPSDAEFVAVDLALGGGRTFNESKHVRAQGGRFGSKGGKSSSGASNNSATTEAPQDFPSLVQTLKTGQSVTLPKTKVKVRKVEGGYQVWDGKTNVLVKTADAAISKAQGLARARAGNRHGSN